jgi:hypothetical protein
MHWTDHLWVNYWIIDVFPISVCLNKAFCSSVLDLLYMWPISHASNTGYRILHHWFKSANEVLSCVAFFLPNIYQLLREKIPFHFSKLFLFIFFLNTCALQDLVFSRKWEMRFNIFCFLKVFYFFFPEVYIRFCGSWKNVELRRWKKV